MTFIHGDIWNVNPIALKRVERLFCKNERAVMRTRLSTGEALTLVPVAAILVASIRLHFLDLTLNAQSRGPTDFPCDARVKKGDELGWFEHGSTIIVLAPENFEFADDIAEGARIRAGEPLMRKPQRLGSILRGRPSIWSRSHWIRNRETREERDGANACSGGGRHCAAAGGKRRWSRSCACASAMNGCCPRASSIDGETPRAAAEREVLEETGHDVAVHEFLGTLVYESGGGSKVVHYWRMEAGDAPVRELMRDVKAVDWLPLGDAVERLSRGYERAFLQHVGPIAMAAARRRPKAWRCRKRRSLRCESTRPTALGFLQSLLRLFR